MGSTTSAPSQPMRAVVRKKGLEFTDTYETPSGPPKKGEVLVKILAAGINPVDYKAPKMLVGPVAGLDYCGTVEAVGEGVDFKIGDTVYGTTRGTLADVAVAKASAMALAPKGMSSVEAAAMPTTYLTSLQALLRRGQLKKGGRVLVIGASGGCGTAALQIARHLEAADIVAVCSGRNAEYCKQHGATRVVDYTKESLADVFVGATDDEKFDVVYDCATASGHGEDYHAVGVALLCEGSPGQRGHGQYVAINGAPGMWLRYATIGQKANQHLFLTDANRADLELLAGLVEGRAAAGGGAAPRGVKPVIDSVFPLSAAGVEEAFTKLKGRRTVGKIVVDHAMPVTLDASAPSE